MGLLRVMMPPKLQLLALLAFAVAMFFLENQIQKLEESRGKLGKFRGAAARSHPIITLQENRMLLGVLMSLPPGPLEICASPLWCI